MRPVSPRFLLAFAALALPLAGCGGGGDANNDDFLQYTSLTPEEPTAGDWRTWLVLDVGTIRPAAPASPLDASVAAELDTLRARALARGMTETNNIDFWNGGTCRRWNEYLRGRVAARLVNPPLASRAYAIVSMAMYDAMVSAFDTKYAYLRARPSAFPNPPATYGVEHDSPSYVSERAAMSAAAREVMNVLFPLDIAATDALHQSAVNADLDACVHFPSDVTAGEAIGHSVALAALARLSSDGGDPAVQAPLTAAYMSTGLVGRWIPTPPAFAGTPLLPGWGTVDTWVLPSADFVRPSAPPAYNSDEWKFQRDEVLDVALTLNAERTNIALFWADGAGTFTPPGHWNQIATDLGVTYALNECRFARMLAALGAAQQDAFIACWECKYFYDIERPVTTIRRDIAGQSGFLPIIATPPFPTYPSGHSSTSGAASQVLGYFFPDDAIELALMANEAKDSRLYGGIHFRFDNDNGLSLGRAIGTFVLDRIATDGSN